MPASNERQGALIMRADDQPTAASLAGNLPPGTLARAILRAVPFDLLLLDDGGRVLFASGSSILEGETAEPRALPEVFTSQPLLAGILQGLHAEARDGRRLAATTVWLGSRDAPDRCCRVVVVPITVPGAARFLAMLEDQSRETQRELQLGLLRRISDRLAGTFDLDRLLFSILTGVTAGHGLGFSRALLFLLDDSGEVLHGRMAVGATSREEALRIWAEIDRKHLTLDDLLDAYDPDRGAGDAPLNRMVCRLRFAAGEDELLGACTRERRPMVVDDARQDRRVRPELVAAYGANEFVVAPLLARDRALGVIVADRQWSGKRIRPEDVEVLRLFGAQAGIALDSAAAHRRAVRSEKLAAVGQFTAKLAHEIRSPLMIIGGFAQALLREGPTSPNFERNLGIVVGEVRRLEGLVKNVNAFVRVAPPCFEPVDVNTLVKAALDQVAAVAEPASGRIRFSADLDPSIGLVQADPAQIRQVLLNLLRNAVEACEALPAGGEVFVATSHERSRARIEVRDTGVGIPPEQAAKLFEPFHSTKPGGTGLGLSISSKIIEDHGGSISVRSEPGKGTTVVAVIPMAREAGEP